jgi:hypothetical protein
VDSKVVSLIGLSSSNAALLLSGAALATFIALLALRRPR